MISTYGQVPYGTSAPAAPNYAIAGPSALAYSFSLPSTATSDSGHSASGMTTILAEQAIARLISADLKEKGFDGAEPQALKRLEEEVVSFFQEIYRRAQDYGNLANRAFPAVADLHQAAVEMGLGPAQLRSTTRKRKRPRKYRLAFELAEPQTKPAPPQLLAYDQDDSLPAIPVTLRSLPNPYPHLPPSHTYLRTPPSPPRKQDGQTRDNKLKNAALVQESLRNLLAQTEDVVDPEDTELLGAIVNWESNTLPRKKWKVHG